MTPWYTDDAVTVWHGDCLDVLADMADNSVDTVVTDAPYGLRDITRREVETALRAWLSGQPVLDLGGT